MAELLLEKETINHDDLVSLIGARPFKGHKSYLEFISAQEDAKQKDADEAKEKEASGGGDGAEEDNKKAEGGGGGGVVEGESKAGNESATDEQDGAAAAGAGSKEP